MDGSSSQGDSSSGRHVRGFILVKAFRAPVVTHWISQQPQTPLTPNFPSNPSVVYVPVQPIVSPLVAPLQGFFIPPSPGPVTSLSPPSTSPPYHPLMFFGQQGAMAHGWRQQTSDTRMSRAGRGSGYGPGRGGVRFSSHRGIRDNGWWDRDFDDGKPRNPWKKVDVYANKVTVGDVEDWPMVGSTNIGQVETQPTPAVERKERKPGMLHLPLNAVTSVNVEERPHSYSQALRTETMTISAKDADDEGEGEGDEFETTEGKKRKKRKDVTNTQEKPQAVRKSKQKISFDFGSLIEELEKVEPQATARKMALGGGIMSAVSYPASQTKPTMGQVGGVPRNVLDSSAPVRYRGKERETPKAKKPSSLKRIILKEREEKRIHRDMPVETEEVVKAKGRHLHSRRFRDYCDQVLDKQIDDLVMKFLQKLVQFQDRQYHKDPTKAKSKRRIVLGLREVHKHLKLQKLKCVIVSPNVESITSQGGIDDLLHQIRAKCEEQKIPIVYALSRRGLGRAVLKKVPVSIVGVFNYDGAQDQFNELLSTVEDARRAYTKLVAEFDGETKRLEEAARSGQSSSSGESSAVSSRKTSKTESETDSVRSDRKISGTSDDGDWTGGGSSQLSAEAPEFHPVPYQQVPQPWTSYHPAPYDYPLSNQMLPMAGTQYYIAHPHGFVTSPPHMSYEGFQSAHFQQHFMAWRDPRKQTYGAVRGNRMDKIPVNSRSVPGIDEDEADEDETEYGRSESEKDVAGWLCDHAESQHEDVVNCGGGNSDGGISEEEKECMAVETDKAEVDSGINYIDNQELSEVEVERGEGDEQEPLNEEEENGGNGKDLERCQLGDGQHEEGGLQEAGSEDETDRMFSHCNQLIEGTE